MPRRAGGLGLRVGDVVEVRSEEEILATLDEKGELDGLPFMPEMLRFCGRRLTVHKVAHKLCDTISRSGLRRMDDAVHLTGARCDGGFHGGCQTACSLYWKEAWLKRVDPDRSPRGRAAEGTNGATHTAAATTPLRPPAPVPENDSAPHSGPSSAPDAPDAPDASGAFGGSGAARAPGDLAAGRPLLPLLEANTRKERGPDGEERYSCQATELLRAAPVCLPFRDVRQYVADVRTGNAGLLATLRGILIGLFNRYQHLTTRLLPRPLRIRGGLRWGFVKGGATGPTPSARLDLKPGELVRIKSKEEILPTLNEDLLNRGMGFEEEMARFCGRTARVVARVDRCVDERTGRMLRMKNPCIILDGIVCAGVYNLNCPREFVPFWREIWLERVPEPGRTAPPGGPDTARTGR